MLFGIDVAHHQTDKVITDFIGSRGSIDFIIHKATEGRTYVDTQIKNRFKKLVNGNILTGFYHFARPDNNEYSAEARHFVQTLSDLGDYSHSLLILDWEDKALNYSFSWAVNWCRMVEDLTGIKPIIYASASYIKQHAKEYDLWWTAHWNTSCAEGCSHDGVTEVLTQYKNSPVDIDIFHGTAAEWKKLTGDRITAGGDPKILYQWTVAGTTYKLTAEEAK